MSDRRKYWNEEPPSDWPVGLPRNHASGYELVLLLAMYAVAVFALALLLAAFL